MGIENHLFQIGLVLTFWASIVIVELPTLYHVVGYCVFGGAGASLIGIGLDDYTH